MQDLGVIDDLEALGHFGRWVGLEVVDVGCGAGHLVRQLGGLGAFVTGIEPDARQVRLAHEQGIPSGSQVLPGRADSLPLERRSQDVVIFNRSLHHVPLECMDAALAEAVRVLRPNGRLLVLEPHPDGQMSQVMEPFHNERLVRAAAQLAVQRLRASQVATYQYHRRYRFPDLGSFRERMRLTTFIDIDDEGLMSDVVARRFEAGLTEKGEGEERYLFHNPITVWSIPASAAMISN